MALIQAPPCKWVHIEEFKLSTTLDKFLIPEWQRILNEVHRGTIVSAILNNQMYNNVITVYRLDKTKVKTGQDYGVCDGQHRLMALYHIHKEYNLSHYELVLQIFNEDISRSLFYRNNLGKALTFGDLAQTFDDGHIRFFNHLRGDYNIRKATKDKPAIANLLHGLKFARSKSPIPIPRTSIESFLKSITKEEITYCKKFTRCLFSLFPYVAESVPYRTPVFQGMFRSGYENDWTDETLKKVIGSTIDSPKTMELVNLTRGHNGKSYIYQYITNELCYNIKVKCNKSEPITYVTKYDSEGNERI